MKTKLNIKHRIETMETVDYLTWRTHIREALSDIRDSINTGQKSVVDYIKHPTEKRRLSKC